MNLWFLVEGKRSVPLKNAKNFQKLPGITLQKYPKMSKFGTKLKRPILVSIDSSRRGDHNEVVSDTIRPVAQERIELYF